MTGTPKQRDLRLDVFRGIAMCIIFIAHVPMNGWTAYIPARFGPSDATEMFVFLSGFASSLAFGGIFVKRGLGMGLARIGIRLWQVYWAHLGLFFVVFAIVSGATLWVGPRDYVAELNLHLFAAEPLRGMIYLFGLQYVPNYFDILPMYLVVLALIPVVMGLRRLHPILPFVFCPALWLAAQGGSLGLPAEWWSDRSWYFDPFAWQLVFFTGFAIGSGWVTLPAVDRRLVIVAAVFALLAAPLAPWPAIYWGDLFEPLRQAMAWSTDKTEMGILRWLHFLAIAYLAAALLQRYPGIPTHAAAAPLVRIGQQSLAAFLTCMALAQVAGVVLDNIGRDALDLAVVNIGGLLILYAICHAVSFFKSAPWSRAPASLPPPALAGVRWSTSERRVAAE